MQAATHPEKSFNHATRAFNQMASSRPGGGSTLATERRRGSNGWGGYEIELIKEFYKEGTAHLVQL